MSNEKQENPERESRNKRFFAIMQNTLGAADTTTSTSSTKLRSRKPGNSSINQKQDELTISEAIKKISISDEDVFSSLNDIKELIVRKASEEKLTEEDYSSLATMLCETALEQTNIYPILEICTGLITHQSFQMAMSECLKEMVGKFLCQEDEKFETVPNIMVQFLINKWPRKYNRAIENSNLILYTIFNTIVGWINFINTESKETNCKQNEEDGGTGNAQIFLRCLEGLRTISNNGQRFLWLGYPDLFDDIYNSNVELLIGNTNLPRSLKSSILTQCHQMVKWSQANTPKYMNATTQTVRREL